MRISTSGLINSDKLTIIFKVLYIITNMALGHSLSFTLINELLIIKLIKL